MVCDLLVKTTVFLGSPRREVGCRWRLVGGGLFAQVSACTGVHVVAVRKTAPTGRYLRQQISGFCGVVADTGPCFVLFVLSRAQGVAQPPEGREPAISRPGSGRGRPMPRGHSDRRSVLSRRQ